MPAHAAPSSATVEEDIVRDILVNTNDVSAWGGGVAYAADLAARIGGALTGAFVHPSAMHMVPPFASANLISTILENAENTERNARASAQAFVDWARAAGVATAAWQVVEGNLPATLAHLGNWHDLLVLERNDEIAWGTQADVGALVLAAGIPCIVVPKGITEARMDCIAIAWKGAIEGVRAIHAAMPLLQRASRVVLLAGRPHERDAETSWRPPFDIDDYLARHGIDATRREIETSDEAAGMALLDAAAAVGADLLVMGAYGRSRVSEWIFGGATKDVLGAARLPVFMRN